MTTHILIDGDQAVFLPAFGAAAVVVQPGRITGSGAATLGSKALCIAGDESSVSVAGCTYSTPQYSTPGTGTLTVSALGGDQKATKTRTGGTAVLLVGSSFTAKFSVQCPAKLIPPSGSPVPDSTPEYTGTGFFVTTNTAFRGA